MTQHTPKFKLYTTRAKRNKLRQQTKISHMPSSTFKGTTKSNDIVNLALLTKIWTIHEMDQEKRILEEQIPPFSQRRIAPTIETIDSAPL